MEETTDIGDPVRDFSQILEDTSSQIRRDVDEIVIIEENILDESSSIVNSIECCYCLFCLPCWLIYKCIRI